MTPNAQKPRFKAGSALNGTDHSPRPISGLKVLNSLAWENLKRRYPEIRECLLPRPHYKDTTANQLTQAIINYIKLLGNQAERISVSGRTIDHRQTFTDVLGHQRTIGKLSWIPGTMTRGSADISATIAGRSFKIEVKVGRDKQSEHQKQYQRDIEAAGGIYLTCRTFQGFYEWYQDYFEAGKIGKSDYAREIYGERSQENQ